MQQSTKPAKSAGMLRVYFADNTYKTLQLTEDSSVQEVIQSLCHKLKGDPSRYELLIIAPMGPLRERKLLSEDRPLRIQEKAGCTAYKFLLREVRRSSTFEGDEGDVDWPLPSVSEDGILQRGELECLTESGWRRCSVVLDRESFWHSNPEAPQLGSGMIKLPLQRFDRVEALEEEGSCSLRIRSSGGESTWRARSPRLDTQAEWAS
ncbi:unnamed protein product [Durusdinium trenchii]|uniref:Ras-associating domain-containing protein n=1 Tax=Durusdinium trenchii TaxID=1381693 RepID=A0ABP0RWP8_9DINO